MTRTEYMVARSELIVIRVILACMTPETKQGYMDRLIDMARNYGTSLDYYESRLGFHVAKMIHDITKKDLKKGVEI